MGCCQGQEVATTSVSVNSALGAAAAAAAAASTSSESKLHENSSNNSKYVVAGSAEVEATTPMAFSVEPGFRKVISTWKKALTESERKNTHFGRLFYDNLFTAGDDNHLKDTLFAKTRHGEQIVNLTQSISLVVGMLGQMRNVLAALEALGHRHVFYLGPPGPETESMFAAVGGALIKTLTELCGEDDMKDAGAEWRHVFGVISGCMLGAMRDEAKALPWLKKFVSRRIAEFRGIMARWSEPDAVDEEELSRAIVAYARGGSTPPALNDKIVVALTNLFETAMAQCEKIQLLTPCVKAATAVAAAVRNAEGEQNALPLLQKLLAGVPQVLEKEFNPLSRYDLMVISTFTDAMRDGMVNSCEEGAMKTEWKKALGVRG